MAIESPAVQVPQDREIDAEALVRQTQQATAAVRDSFRGARVTLRAVADHVDREVANLLAAGPAHRQGWGRLQRLRAERVRAGHGAQHDARHPGSGAPVARRAGGRAQRDGAAGAGDHLAVGQALGSIRRDGIETLSAAWRILAAASEPPECGDGPRDGPHRRDDSLTIDSTAVAPACARPATTPTGMPSARRGNCSANLHSAIPKWQAVVPAPVNMNRHDDL